MDGAVPATGPRPRAVMVTKYYWPEPIGSAPFCAGLAGHLARGGLEVDVLTSRPHYPGGRVRADYRDGSRDRERHEGVAVHRVVPALFGSGALGRMVSDAAFLLRGGWAVARGRVAAAPLVVSVSPTVLATLLAGFLRTRDSRLVVLVHAIESGLASGLGMVGGRFLQAGIRRLERALLGRADLVLVLSADMRDQLLRIGVEARIEVLPIWVDTERLRPLPRPAGQPFTAMYSGNFGRKQGLMQVVELAAELQRRGSPVRVVLRGDGGQAGELRRAVAERGLGNVEFRPLLPADRLAEGLAEADLHLVPQDPRAADFAVPSKIFAIMAAGRPFLATAGEGSQLWKLQRECDGFRCLPPERPAALADAVEALAADPERLARMGARCREHVVARYSRERVLADFDALLDSLEDAPCRPTLAAVS